MENPNKLFGQPNIYTVSYILFLTFLIFCFLYSINYDLSQDVECTSLYYTLGPCCLSILNVIFFIYQPQTLISSFSQPLLLATASLFSMCMSLFLFCSVQFSCSVMSDYLQPHGLQHTRLPYPSLTSGTCSNSCLSSQ